MHEFEETWMHLVMESRKREGVDPIPPEVRRMIEEDKKREAQETSRG